MLREDDLPFLYAAYRKGSFPHLDGGMNAVEFIRAAVERLERIEAGWMLTAPVNGEKRPVGVVVGRFDEYGIMWPHVVWFPWASQRNRFEAAAKFLADMRKETMVMILPEPKDIPMFSQLTKLAIVRPIGSVMDLFDEKTIMFQTRGN